MTKKEKELYISFNFITNDKGYYTGLNNYRNHKDWVENGFWVDYFIRKDKAVAMSELNAEREKELTSDLTLLGERKKNEILKTYREYLKANLDNPPSGLYAFKNGKYFKNIDIKEVKEASAKLKTPFYDMVISSNDDMLKNGMIGEDAWKKLIEDCLFKWLKSSGLGFDISNLEIYYAIHGNTNNPHIHISFWETKLKRNKDRKLFGIQQNITRRKFEELKLDILSKFTFDEDIEKINKLNNNLRNIKIKFEKKLIENENSREVKKEFKSEIDEIKKECQINNNQWYSHLTPHSQKIILKIKETLMKNNHSFFMIYNNFYKTLNEYKKLEIDSQILKEEFMRRLLKEEKEFERKINNAILKEVLKFERSEWLDKKTNSTKNTYKNSFKKMFEKDFAYYDKDTKYLKRLAYQFFESKSIEEYEKMKGISYE